MIVLLDSSILLEAVKNRADLREIKYLAEEKVCFAIPSAVFFELKYLSKNKGRRGIKARVAWKLLEQLNAFVLGSLHRKADEAMIAFASKEIAVATLDLKVKKIAQEKGAKVFTLKQCQYVQEL